MITLPDIYMGLQCTWHCSMRFIPINPSALHGDPSRSTIITISVLYTRKLKPKVTLLINGKAGF